MRLPVLYPITDRRLAGGRAHAEIVRMLAEAGADLVQVREKRMTDRALAAAVRECVAIRGVRILVNDRPDVARVCRAAGAHLGDRDLPAGDARTLLGRRAILGVSCHSAEEVAEACRLDVDYVAIGPVFATVNATVTREPLGLEVVEAAAAAAAAATVPRPLVAIGGITLERAPLVLAAGASSVAVLSDLMAAPDIAARARAFLDLGRARGGARRGR
jgi:thiamine-phosphate pyrophosphorylase